VNGPDPVYQKTYGKALSLDLDRRSDLIQRIAKVVERNEAYYRKFPEDAKRVKKIHQYLAQNKPRLGSGFLTPRRFQQLGIRFGGHGKPI
jgi:hypothetical protein